MKTKKLMTFLPNVNVFTQDASNMGIQLGLSPNGNGKEKIMAMMMNHDNEVCDRIYIIDEATGERIQIEF